MAERSLHYILDENGEPQPIDDVIAWGQWFESARHGARIVAHDRDEGDNGLEIFISTVFLGLDHNFSQHGPPVLWETMVSGGLLDGEMDRYTSRAAALRGHQAMCEMDRYTSRAAALRGHQAMCERVMETLRHHDVKPKEARRP